MGVAVVIVAAKFVGEGARRLGQPAVIGEVLAGILLGPSLLGDASSALFPEASRPLLDVIARLGVVMFMFSAGLEMDLREIRSAHRRTVGTIGVVGTLFPFALGMALAPVLHESHGEADAWPFALFIGASMSITAFPVLARILMDRNLYATSLGSLAMASAAVDDVLTWATLAFVVTIITSSGTWDVPYMAAGIAAMLAVLLSVRPLLHRFADHAATPTAFSTIVAATLACSYLTATLGAHEIFGAFLLGAVFPRGRLSAHLSIRLDPLSAILLPVFFVTAGLGVDIRAVGWVGALEFGVILGVAFAGKIIGVTAAAKACGIAAREAVGLGVLMNTRGLTELIVLSIGRELGVLDDSLYTLLVGMALVTTAATAPLLSLVKPSPQLEPPGADQHA